MSDEEGFTWLFIRYYPLVFQLAFRYVGQEAEAEDIAQEVFLRFYHLPPHGTTEAQQKAWLCRVAINLGLNAVRRKAWWLKHHEVLDLDVLAEGEVSSGIDPEGIVLAGEQAALVREVLTSLPERQRVCLMLRSIDFSYQEISEVTSIPITSIGTILTRATKTFRRTFNERTTKVH